MANKIIIVIVVVLIIALVVMLVLSLTAKDEGYYADNITLSSDVNGGKMTQPLVSGNYKLVLEDNRLVLYDMFNNPTWWVSSRLGSYLVMQSDGNLVLYDSSDNPFWSTQSNGKEVGLFSLKLSGDGSMQIIDKNQNIIKILTYQNGLPPRGG